VELSVKSKKEFSKKLLRIGRTNRFCNGFVLLSGIGFLVTKEKIRITRRSLLELTNEYRLPAFGIVLTDENRIEPYVYVKQTNSLFKETACGSASIATNIILGINKIIQPTGESIYVENKQNKIRVSAKVVALGC